MAKKWSNGTINFIAAKGSLRQVAAKARCLIFEGSQPANADTASTGSTLKATLTSGGAAFVGETLAEWQATLTGVAGTLAALVLGGLVRGNTAQAGAAGTITLDAAASAVDDEYNGCYCLITSGTGAGQMRRISDYDGTGKVATLESNWTVNPDATSVFQVIAGVDILEGSTIAFTTSLANTAALAVAAINNAITFPDMEAYVSGDAIMVQGPKASGSLFNGLRLYGVGVDGLTVTVAGSGQPVTWGVDGSGGATWLSPAVLGEIAKEATNLQGNADANGTAGWFRFCFDPDDDGLSASTEYPRLDGVIGAGSGDMSLQTTSLVSGVPVVITSFPLSVLST